MEAEVWDERKLVAGRNHKLLINGAKAPVHCGDEKLQRCRAYRQGVLQCKEPLAATDIRQETDPESYCRYSERDNGKELIRAAETIV